MWEDMEPACGERLLVAEKLAGKHLTDRLLVCVDRYREADGVSFYRYTLGNIYGSICLARSPVLAQVLRIASSKLDRVRVDEAGLAPHLLPPRSMEVA